MPARPKRSEGGLNVDHSLLATHDSRYSPTFSFVIEFKTCSLQTIAPRYFLHLHWERMMAAYRYK